MVLQICLPLPGIYITRKLLYKCKDYHSLENTQGGQAFPPALFDWKIRLETGRSEPGTALVGDKNYRRDTGLRKIDGIFDMGVSFHIGWEKPR